MDKKLTFGEKPQYNYLKFILISELLDLEKIPQDDVLMPGADNRHSREEEQSIEIDEEQHEHGIDPSLLNAPRIFNVNQ